MAKTLGDSISKFIEENPDLTAALAGGGVGGLGGALMTMGDPYARRSRYLRNMLLGGGLGAGVGFAGRRAVAELLRREEKDTQDQQARTTYEVNDEEAERLADNARAVARRSDMTYDEALAHVAAVRGYEERPERSMPIVRRFQLPEDGGEPGAILDWMTKEPGATITEGGVLATVLTLLGLKTAGSTAKTVSAVREALGGAGAGAKMPKAPLTLAQRMQGAPFAPDVQKLPADLGLVSGGSKVSPGARAAQATLRRQRLVSKIKNVMKRPGKGVRGARPTSPAPRGPRPGGGKGPRGVRPGGVGPLHAAGEMLLAPAGAEALGVGIGEALRGIMGKELTGERPYLQYRREAHKLGWPLAFARWINREVGTAKDMPTHFPEIPDAAKIAVPGALLWSGRRIPAPGRAGLWAASAPINLARTGARESVGTAFDLWKLHKMVGHRTLGR